MGDGQECTWDTGDDDGKFGRMRAVNGPGTKRAAHSKIPGAAGRICIRMGGWQYLHIWIVERADIIS